MFRPSAMVPSTVLFAVVLVAACTSSVTAAASSCGLTIKGSTFDLSPLTLSNAAFYTVRDLVDSRTRNFTYLFNICSNIVVPSQCSSLNNSIQAPAYQADNNGYCYRLGNSAASEQISLLDNNNPAAGVKLIYPGGDKCPGNINRALTLQLMCADIASTQPSSRVSELSTCDYSLTFQTLFACPLECGIANRRLCAGHGICKYDVDASASRCFCNQGYSGNDCSQLDSAAASASSAHCDGFCVALVFVVILLVAAIVGAIVLLYRVRKIATAKNKFSSLRSDFSNDDEVSTAANI